MAHVFLRLETFVTMLRVLFAALPLLGVPLSGAAQTLVPTTAPTSAASQAPSASSLSAPEMTIRVLDVGQGDATLITTPSGQHILIDAGPDRSAVRRRLEDLGVRSLALVVTTHQHADHLGGMAAVLSTVPVQRYLDNGSLHPTATARGVLAALQTHRVPSAVARQESFAIDGVTITLYPGATDRKADENDKSIGIHIAFGQATAFVAGDGESVARAVWERAGLTGRVDLLRVGHHGSSNGIDLRQLRRLRPRWAAISVGASNTYGHPHERTLRYLAAAKAVVYRTDRHGELIFRATAAGQWRLPEDTP